MKQIMSLIGALLLVFSFLLFSFSSMKYAKSNESPEIKEDIGGGAIVVLDDPEKTAGDRSLMVAFSLALIGAGMLFLGTRKEPKLKTKE